MSEKAGSRELSQNLLEVSEAPNQPERYGDLIWKVTRSILERVNFLGEQACKPPRFWHALHAILEPNLAGRQVIFSFLHPYKVISVAVSIAILGTGPNEKEEQCDVLWVVLQFWQQWLKKPVCKVLFTNKVRGLRSTSHLKIAYSSMHVMSQSTSA